jgi:hypothetical protein
MYMGDTKAEILIESLGPKGLGIDATMSSAGKNSTDKDEGITMKFEDHRVLRRRPWWFLVSQIPWSPHMEDVRLNEALKRKMFSNDEENMWRRCSSV